MSGSHTPGPWAFSQVRYRRDAMDWLNITAGERETLVATVLAPSFHDDSNARLIAAAPYMFDVLDATAADPLEMNSWSDEMVRGWAYAAARNAQSAIAKALGEQP